MIDALLAQAEREMAQLLIAENQRGGLPGELMDRLLSVLRAPVSEATALLAGLYRSGDGVPDHLQPAAEWWQTLVNNLWALVEMRAELEATEEVAGGGVDSRRAVRAG